MSRSRLYTTEAIILRRSDFGEADRLLTIMTPDRGKLRVLAKGARKITSRKAGHIELFTRTQLLLAQGRTFDIVTQAELHEPYMTLREDVLRGTLAHYLSELVDQFAQEGSEDTAMYELMSEGLGWLCDAPDPRLAARQFELRLLTLTGYRPQLFKCARTGEPLESDLIAGMHNPDKRPPATAFSPLDGGALCNRASASARELVMLSYSALQLLRVLQTESYERVRELQVTEDIQAQAERALQRYYALLMERIPKSTQFLRQL